MRGTLCLRSTSRGYSRDTVALVSNKLGDGVIKRPVDEGESMGCLMGKSYATWIDRGAWTGNVKPIGKYVYDIEKNMTRSRYACILYLRPIAMYDYG